MTRPRFVGVIEIDKASASVLLVDLDRVEVLVHRTRPNGVLGSPPYPHFDIEGLWEFFCGALAEIGRSHRIDALSVTTHGAAAALVTATGALALPVLDYEFNGPDALRSEYDKTRPDFSESFAPHLPGGLNLGAQLFWLERQFPEAFASTRWILPYPQYWTFRLTGVASADMTSLGSHTDLWDFRTDLYSSLVMRQNWLNLMPDVLSPTTCLGLTTPEATRACGLAHPVPVYAGIHDSNAALLPHLVRRGSAFSVVSSETWVVVTAPGGDSEHLDPERDTLMGIDAFGRHLPIARFMGGREWDTVTRGVSAEPSEETIERVLAGRIMLLPSITEGSGPFPHHQPRWTAPRPSLDPETLTAVASFYLALMTSECLGLVGAEGPTILEGRFAENACYARMLAAATGRPVEPNRTRASGVALGAALLARTDLSVEPETRPVPDPSPAMAAYAEVWRKRA